MANKIILKKTSTAAKVPLASDLEVGEIAVNLADQKLYSKNASGTVILVGDGQGTGDVIGPSSAVNNNFTAFDGTTGKLVKDSGFNSASFATAAQGALADTAIQNLTSTDGSITITDFGTTVDLVVQSAGTATNATNLLAQVRNETGATLTKGTLVYISGASGNKALVSKAQANSETTSSATFGMVTDDILTNQNGYVTISGEVVNLNTSAFAEGATLYLSPTVAGGFTDVKPYAPQNLVYVGTVIRSHVNQGVIQTRIQNGYELDELHNVAAQSPTTGQTIVWNSATSLWEKNTVSLTAGVNGTLPVANGGTGQTTATAAFNALAPTQTSNSGKYLTTDGTNTAWATVDALPSQATHSGQYLTTDGTTASWATIDTGGGPVTINSTIVTTAVNIGSNQNGFSIGPMTIEAGGSVTIATGQQWVIW